MCRPKGQRQRQLSFIAPVTSLLIVITGARNTGRGGLDWQKHGQQDGRRSRPADKAIKVFRFLPFPLSRVINKAKEACRADTKIFTSFLLHLEHTSTLVADENWRKLTDFSAEFGHAPADRTLTPHAVNEEKIKTVSFFSFLVATLSRQKSAHIH